MIVCISQPSTQCNGPTLQGAAMQRMQRKPKKPRRKALSKQQRGHSDCGSGGQRAAAADAEPLQQAREARVQQGTRNGAKSYGNTLTQAHARLKCTTRRKATQRGNKEICNHCKLQVRINNGHGMTDEGGWPPSERRRLTSDTDDANTLRRSNDHQHRGHPEQQSTTDAPKPHTGPSRWQQRPEIRKQTLHTRPSTAIRSTHARAY
jgi:hypothetical protein